VTLPTPSNQPTRLSRLVVGPGVLAGERESGIRGMEGVGAVSGWDVMAVVVVGGSRGRGSLVDLGVTEVFAGELGLVP